MRSRHPYDRQRQKAKDTRGTYGAKEEQVANARESYPDLTPASEEPAAAVTAAWAALLPDTTPPDDPDDWV